MSFTLDCVVSAQLFVAVSWQQCSVPIASINFHFYRVHVLVVQAILPICSWPYPGLVCESCLYILVHRVDQKDNLRRGFQ